MAFNVDHQMPLEEGLDILDIETEVLQEYEKRGFALPSCPQQMDAQGAIVLYRGYIPDDLSMVGDDDLAKYMTLLSHWLEYVGTTQTLADMAHKKAEAQLNFTLSTIRLTYKTDQEGKKRTMQERDDLVQVDRRYIAAKKSALFTEEYNCLVQSVYDAARQKYKVVSRRITQRGQELERGFRNTSGANTLGNLTPSFPGRRTQ